jgi:hypothetical protein
MKQCRVIPARIISITKKYVFLTIGCEQIGWGNTRLFNVSIPLSVFSQQNKSPDIGQIHAVQVLSFDHNRHKPWEYFITAYLVDKMPSPSATTSLRPTLADVVSTHQLDELRTKFG